MRASQVTALACPRLVPLIEGDDPYGEETADAVREYAAPLKEAGVDTVILGCTHYPLIRPILQRVLRPRRDARLLGRGDRARGGGDARRKRIENGAGARGRRIAFSRPAIRRASARWARRFLQLPIGEVERVEVAALEQAAA